jgi:hypothetical protein
MNLLRISTNLSRRHDLWPVRLSSLATSGDRQRPSRLPSFFYTSSYEGRDWETDHGSTRVRPYCVGVAEAEVGAQVYNSSRSTRAAPSARRRR